MDLGLNLALKHAIVQGISTGFSDFLTQKKVFESELLVSSAFAWMKSNYVDSSVAKNVPKSVKYEIKHVGSWKYIAFEVSVNGSIYRFVLKPPMVLDSLKNSEYYLFQDSIVNKEFVNSAEFKAEFSIPEQNTIEDSFLVMPEQMTLFEGKEEDRFYIITYDVDLKNGLNTIEIFVPYNGRAYAVDNLTDLITELDLTIPEELLKSENEYGPEDDSYFEIDPSNYGKLNIVRRPGKDKEKDKD